ncbi:MAG: hypothetical protein ACFFCW_09040 [Candidatus Hodarchaeota archaeon]
MCCYTIHKDPRIDETIEGHMDYVTKRLIDTFGKHQVEAIVLIGGFGRGEGGVIINEKEIRPFHDYDFALVPKGKLLNEKQLMQLSGEFEERFLINEVSLWQITNKRLTTAPLTVHNYEMKCGHKVIWGNQLIFDTMPEYNSHDIPLFEATRLLYNRALDFMKAQHLLNKKSPTIREKVYFLNSCNKVTLAIGESILLWQKKYHFSYRKRRDLFRRIRDLPFGDDSIVSSLTHAIDFKLNPDLDRYESLDRESLCQQIRELHERYFGFIERQRLDTDFGNWNEYASILIDSKKPALHAVRNLVRNLYNIRLYGVQSKFPFKTLYKDHTALKLVQLPQVLYQRFSPNVVRLKPDLNSSALRYI